MIHILTFYCLLYLYKYNTYRTKHIQNIIAIEILECFRRIQILRSRRHFYRISILISDINYDLRMLHVSFLSHL